MNRKIHEDELEQKLDEARALVSVGSEYRHYKGGHYIVIDLAITESDNSVCVIYRALYGRGLMFTRPVSSWTEEVKTSDGVMKRFQKTN